MIKNIVFDIGNVLVTFRPANYFEVSFNNRQKSERLCKLIFSHDAWSKYDQGIYQMCDLQNIFQAIYPKDYADISYILKNWLNLMELMPDTLAYLRTLKKEGYRIYLLSNISKDAELYLRKHMPFFNEVTGMVLSYAENINKPDPKIYNALLTRYQLIPKETIFFDDVCLNIEQAKALGIHGIHFLNLEDAKKQAEEIIRGNKTC